MKIYVVSEIGYAYNDEYHSRPSCGGGDPVKAFKSKKRAVEEAKALDKVKYEKAKEYHNYRNEDARPIKKFYEVVEVEVADEDVVGYEGARKKVEEAKKAAQEASRVAFKAGSAELFEAHPDLESFGWRQYTPYFNDGDECVFGVRSDFPDLNGMDENGGDEEDYEAYYKLEKKFGKSVSEFLSQFSDDDMKFLFGDHVRVTVFRDGKIEVEDYHHN